MIKVEGLNFKYSNDIYVLKDMNFAICDGERVGLIGANGAGKSTLLKLFVGLVGEHEGRIQVDDLELSKKNLADIRNRIGYVFQDSEAQLFMSTVYEDVAFGPRNMGILGKELDERVMNALAQVHIEELKDRQIYRMSGGQKKLAAIATILSMEPSIILLDEPSIALDPRNRRNLIGVLNEMVGTKIIASHDMDLIKKTCDRVIFVEKGTIVYDGTVDKLMDNEEFLIEHGM